MKRTTSRELAAPIAEKLGVDESLVRKILLQLDDEIGQRVVAGERVEITGLGTFQLIVLQSTRRQVPGVGMIKVPSKWDIKFNPSRSLEYRYAGIPLPGAETIEEDPTPADTIPGPDDDSTAAAVVDPALDPFNGVDPATLPATEPGTVVDMETAGAKDEASGQAPTFETADEQMGAFRGKLSAALGDKKTAAKPKKK